MKVPTSLVGRTRQANTSVEYLRAGATAEAFGAGVGSGLERIAGAVELYQQKAAQQKKFQALTALSNWQRTVDGEVMRLKQESPDDDAEYFPRVNATLQNMENKFLEGVPPEFQDEMKLRVTEAGNAFRERELQYDIQKKDKFFARKIGEELEASKIDLSRDPAQLEIMRQRQFELIDNSGLSPALKGEAKRQASLELGKVGYRQQFKNQRLNEAAPEAFVAKIFQAESGGRAEAKNPNSSAYGPAQFIKSTWAQFIKERHADEFTNEEDIQKLRSNPEYAREATLWYAEKNAEMIRGTGQPVDMGTLYLAHFAGTEGGRRILTAPPSTPIESVMTPDALAANDFLRGKTVGEVIQWAYGKMDVEANNAALDYNPQFADLPYEDRLLIREDVNREIAEAERIAAAERKALVDQAHNDFLVGALDGVYGRADLDRARQRGLFSDVDQLQKAYAIFDKRDKEVGDYNYFAAKIQNPNATWVPGDAKDKDAMDSYFKVKLDKAIDELDPQAIVPLTSVVDKAQMIPPAAVGKLTAMASNPDWKRAQYALDMLSSLRQSAPTAFADATSDEEARMVTLFENGRTYMTPEQLQELVQPSRDPQVQRAREAMAVEATKIVEKNYPAANVYGKFKSLWTFGEDAFVGANPGSIALLGQEFGDLYTEMYSKLGDPKAAESAALTMLKRNWGFSPVGGKLMKHPPQAVPMNGSTDWMDREALLTIASDVNGVRDALDGNIRDFSLVSDLTTDQEVLARKAGQLSRQPSYRVAYIDASGVQRVTDARVHFDPPEYVTVGRDRDLTVGQARQRLTEAELELMDAEQLALRSQIPVPDELRKRVDGLRAIYESELATVPVEPGPALAPKERLSSRGVPYVPEGN